MPEEEGSLCRELMQRLQQKTCCCKRRKDQHIFQPECATPTAYMIRQSKDGLERLQVNFRATTVSSNYRKSKSTLMENSILSIRNDLQDTKDVTDNGLAKKKNVCGWSKVLPT